MRLTLPKRSFTSFNAGTALSVTRVPPRSTSNSSVSPALVLTKRCISLKLSIARPLMDSTRSPGWNPAAAAALSD